MMLLTDENLENLALTKSVIALPLVLPRESQGCFSPQSWGAGGAFFKGDPMPAPINFTEWSLPDSKLTKKATQLVADVSPEFLYNHCMRTYLFSEALGQRDSLKYDRELLYLSALMHDLGLTKSFTGEQRFEVDGADAARAFVLKHGLSEEKAEIVWDAIALHTSIGIASRKQPEIALVHVAAGMDAFGLRLQDITPESVEKILEAYPRLGFNQSVTDLFIENIKGKPHVAAFTWLAEVGRKHIHGFACPSFDDVLQNSPFDK
jgi:HD domain